MMIGFMIFATDLFRRYGRKELLENPGRPEEIARESGYGWMESPENPVAACRNRG